MPIVLLILALVTPTMLAAGEDGRVALGPALILMRDLAPGSETLLSERSGARYQLRNPGGASIAIEVAAVVPASYAPKQWEIGFEPLPDAAWLNLAYEGKRAQRHRIEIPAGGSASLDLIVSLPARADLANRHFIAFVEAGQPSTAALGAQLRLRGRVMIETAAADAGMLPAEGALVWEPSRIDMHLGVDGIWEGSSRLSPAQAGEVDILPLDKVYGGQEADKQARFFSRLSGAAVGMTWAAPDQGRLALAAETPATVRFRGQPSGSPGIDREEVWIAARRAAPGTDDQLLRMVDGVAYDRFEMLRLRYPAAPAPAASATAAGGSR